MPLRGHAYDPLGQVPEDHFMSIKSVKAIIFDHDGTLVNSEGIHFNLWRKMLKNWGIDFKLEEYVRNLSGLPKPQCAEYLAKRFNTPYSEKELYSQNIDITHAHLQKEAYPLMPGAVECLANCKDLNLPMAIATGAGDIEIEASLTNHKMKHFFNSVCTRDKVANPKPAPDVYELALKELGVNARDAIAIEDTYNGLAAAKSARIETIAIPNEFSSSQDFSRADHIVTNLSQAYELIKSKV